MSTQSILGRARHRGTARTLRYHTSGSKSQPCCKQESTKQGKWGTGRGKGNCKAASVTCNWRIGSEPGWTAAVLDMEGRRFHQGEEKESAQVLWHRKMPLSQISTDQMLQNMRYKPQKEHVKASSKRCTRNYRCVEGCPFGCQIEKDRAQPEGEFMLSTSALRQLKETARL